MRMLLTSDSRLPVSYWILKATDPAKLQAKARFSLVISYLAVTKGKRGNDEDKDS